MLPDKGIIMIRIFARHQTAVDGKHWHIVATGSTMKSALKTLNRRWELSASYGRELWYDNSRDSRFKRLAPTL